VKIITTEATANLRGYVTDVDKIVKIWQKRMKWWKRGEKRPTVADVIHDLIEKEDGK